MGILSLLIGPISKLLERIIPDPAAQQAAKLQLLQMTQQGALAQLDSEVKEALSQADIDKQNALSADPFARDWRPFIGWTCGLALAYDFVLRPLLAWYSLAHKIDVPPELDLSTMLPLLGALLGTGVLQHATSVVNAQKAKS